MRLYNVLCEKNGIRKSNSTAFEKLLAWKMSGGDKPSEVEYVAQWLDDLGSDYNGNKTAYLDMLETQWKEDRCLLIYAYNLPNKSETFISYPDHPFTVSGNDVTMGERYAYYDYGTTASVLSNTRTLTDGGDDGKIKYFGTRADVRSLM